MSSNRELVEWMRAFNADPSHRVKLQFYEFDSPTEMIGTDSPSHVLHFVLDYLASIDSASGQEYRQRIDSLLGQDSDWEKLAAMMDPTKSVGLSPEATFALTPQSFTDFDWLAVLDSTAYSRGGPPLEGLSEGSKQ